MDDPARAASPAIHDLYRNSNPEERSRILKKLQDIESAKSTLRATLNESRTSPLYFIGFLMAMVVPQFSIMYFEAPIATKLVLSVTFTLAVMGALELWTVQRRLEAAILLLLDARKETD